MSLRKSKKKIYIVHRGDPETHRVLYNIIQYKHIPATRLYNSKRDIVRLVLSRDIWRGYIIIPDPLVYTLLIILRPWSYKQILFFSFEMYGYTRPNIGLRNYVVNYVWKILQYIALRTAVHIVFSNELRKKFYLKKYSFLRQKQVCIFENYALSSVSSVVMPQTTHMQEVYKLMQNTSVRWIVYAGSLQEERDVYVLIRAFLKAHPKTIGLIFAGRDKLGFQQYITSLCHPRIVYVGNLSFEETALLLKYATIGFMHYDERCLNTRFCAPLKLYEYVQHALYIIANDNEGLRAKKKIIDAYYSNEHTLTQHIKTLDQQKHIVPKSVDYSDIDFEHWFDILIKCMNISV